MAAAQSPAGANACVIKIDLAISCQNLPNMDIGSKSDPIVIVYQTDFSGNGAREVGRTEGIKDNLNPRFVTKIRIDYHFEENQYLKFVAYDVDDPRGALNQQDFLGEAKCLLSDIVTAREQTLVKDLVRPVRSGHPTITVVAEEIQAIKYTITAQFSARRLDKKNTFGKSDPFYIISRMMEGGRTVPVLRCDPIMKTLDPLWKPFTITDDKISNGDLSRTLEVKVYDWEKDGDHELIGQCQISLSDMQKGTKEWPLVNPAKKNKKGYTNSGTFVVSQFKLEKHHSFLEYIAGGCEMNLVVAVDFTKSNGNPSKPNSLHYNNPHSPNEYVKAIIGSGEVLCHYDSDSNYPMYGFGGKVPPTNDVSHCWPLTGNPDRPEVHGIQGMIDAYQRALNMIELHGPTNMSEIVAQAKRLASATPITQQHQHYTLLLVITDGILNDMDNTIDEIVDAANNLPLSIIIVGVGNADFKQMETLDADDIPLRDRRGIIAKRDIVQFVPMSRLRSSGATKEQIARQLLAEIPNQMLGFFKAKNIDPNPERIGIQHRGNSISNLDPYAQPQAAATAAATAATAVPARPPGSPPAAAFFGQPQPAQPYPNNYAQPPVAPTPAWSPNQQPMQQPMQQQWQQPPMPAQQWQQPPMPAQQWQQAPPAHP